MLKSYLSTPICKLEVTGNSTHIESIDFLHNLTTKSKISKQSDTFPYPILEQLNEYFSGDRHIFDLAFIPTGSPFQKKVWSSLRSIPYAKTVSYTEIALKIGRPESVRSVATAIGKNPLPILIPCHRVIGKNGTLNGYSGGLEIKQFLLNHEKNNSENC